MKAPANAVLFNLTPIKDTAKPGRPWEKIVERSEERKFNPSTDASSIKELRLTHDEVALTLLYNLKLLDTIIKNVLRPEEPDPTTGQIRFVKGLMSHSRPETQRVHTSLSQLTETGRYRSSNPNLQNIPLKQQPEYTAVLESLGYQNVPVIRSCFVATPGWLLVANDYMGAELDVMASYSGDTKMLAIMADPRRDLHMETANDMFKLGLNLVGISKDEMNAIKSKYKPDRIKAKAVNFGIPYGLGAPGLYMDLRSQGVSTSMEECRGYLEAHGLTYPQLHEFLDMCANCVTHQGYFDTVWGRRRRFHPGVDQEQISRQERQAKNFPIQSVVADCLTLAIINFWEYKKVYGESRFRMILPIHDATINEVKPDFLRQFVTEVVPQCMCMPIPKLSLTLRVDCEINLRWGEKPTRQEVADAGVAEKDFELIELAD